jgi:type IV pilus assembly protein PilO
MPKNSNLAWTAKLRDPRVVMRVVIGLLLVANLAAAIVAFKPFGGSAEDLRRQAESLRAQLSKAQNQLAESKKLVQKVQGARSEGDQFMTKYVTDQRVWSSTIQAELNRLADEAGIKAGQQSYSEEQVEGSDTITMLTITAGFEGSYANLA